MSSWLPALVCIIFVIHLFRRDIKSSADESTALWIPLAWMFLVGSRYVSAWLNVRPPGDSVEAIMEGSPIDRAVFLGLLIGGLVALSRRNIDWKGLLLKNKLFLFYFLYCLLSTTWSDVPAVALKRWVKDLGNPIMVLVILTTPRPLHALTQTLRRLSFLWLPLSVLFVKYYPELGRQYHVDGSPLYIGVGTQKNDLGLMCLVTGIYFFWQVVQDRERFLGWTRSERFRIYLLTAMMVWLLHISDSQTSLSCLIAAVAVIFAGHFPFVRQNPTRLADLALGSGLAYIVLNAFIDIKAQIIALLGRRPDLTDRTDIWKALLSVNSDPVFGTGFMSFWTGERMEKIWKMVGAPINQAHNGYLEQYLNLGYIGLGFIFLLLVAAFLNARAQLKTDPSMGALTLCFLLVAVLYNYTEASFYGLNNMWILLLLAVIRVSPPRNSLSLKSANNSPMDVSDDQAHQPRNC